MAESTAIQLTTEQMQEFVPNHGCIKAIQLNFDNFQDVKDMLDETCLVIEFFKSMGYIKFAFAFLSQKLHFSDWLVFFPNDAKPYVITDQLMKKMWSNSEALKS